MATATNEELAQAIKDGHEELLPVLWMQVRKYIVKAATRYLAAAMATGTRDHAIDADDLISASYLAMYDSIRTFDPDRGSFISALAYRLKACFIATNGGRNVAQKAFNLSLMSIDQPITGDDDDEISLSDTIGADDPALEEIHLNSEQQALRAALESYLDRVCQPKQADVIRRRYFRNETQKAIAEAEKLSPQRVAAIETKALERLQSAAITDSANELRRISGIKTSICWRHFAMHSIHDGKRETEENAILLSNIDNLRRMYGLED